MLRRNISSLATAAIVAAFALMVTVPVASANIPGGAVMCLIRPDRSAIDLKGTARLANAPADSEATVTARFVAGSALYINGGKVAPGTPIGESHTGTFDPNDSDHPYTWTERATDAGPSGDFSVEGDVNVVIEAMFVTLANGKSGWHQDGVETFPGNTGCSMSNNTTTNTVTITTPGQTVTVTNTVPTPGATITKNHKVVVRKPHLYGYKTARLNTLVPGQNANYVEHFCNGGTADAHGVVGWDIPRAGLTFRDASGGTIVGGKLRFNLGTLRAGTCQTRGVHLKVDLTASGRKHVCNGGQLTATDAATAKPFEVCNNVALLNLPKKPGGAAG